MLNYQRVCDIHGSQNSSEATSNHSFALPGTHTDSKLSKAHLKERTWRGGKNCVTAPTQGLLQASLFQGTVEPSQTGACGLLQASLFSSHGWSPRLVATVGRHGWSPRLALVEPKCQTAVSKPLKEKLDPSSLEGLRRWGKGWPQQNQNCQNPVSKPSINTCMT